jgi:hypothetical protein
VSLRSTPGYFLERLAAFSSIPAPGWNPPRNGGSESPTFAVPASLALLIMYLENRGFQIRRQAQIRA